ncbi:MAG: hypothetical protein K8I82_27035 [Anaerolineae bacterium]|nr:hypothetical protein [Anaerolineae bacterium]
MDTQQEKTSSSAIMILLLLILLPPLLCAILLFTTDLYVSIGRALGMNLPANDNLIVYDATCWKDGSRYRINVVYWTRESAPMSATAGERKSPSVTANAGINTLEVILNEVDGCPNSVTLTDESRSRTAGGSVEDISSDESG